MYMFGVYIFHGRGCRIKIWDARSNGFEVINADCFFFTEELLDVLMMDCILLVRKFGFLMIYFCIVGKIYRECNDFE